MGTREKSLFGHTPGNDRFFERSKTAQKNVPIVDFYFGYPFEARVIPKDAAMPRCIITSELMLVMGVYRLICNAKVFASIVKFVAIYVVNNFAPWNAANFPVHQYHGEFFARPITSVSIPHRMGDPTKSLHNRNIVDVNYGDGAFCQRHKRRSISAWLNCRFNLLARSPLRIWGSSGHHQFIQTGFAFFKGALTS
jgi:hypothetical protein